MNHSSCMRMWSYTKDTHMADIWAHMYNISHRSKKKQTFLHTNAHVHARAHSYSHALKNIHANAKAYSRKHEYTQTYIHVHTHTHTHTRVIDESHVEALKGRKVLLNA